MYRIIRIHEADAYYKDRKVLIGRLGEFKKSTSVAPSRPKGYVGGSFTANRFIKKLDTDDLFFYAVRVEKIKTKKRVKNAKS